ncbi:MAG: hypothetical protein AABX70_08750 [Nanoarchaeota archaeon]
MKQTGIGMVLIGLFLLSVVPALAISISGDISPSGSYVYVNKMGTLSWNSVNQGFYDQSTLSSSTSLTLNPSQKMNVNNRMGELLVRLSEEYFKNQLLTLLTTKSMLDSTPLLATLVNGNLIVWDSTFTEMYNANHVKLSQTSVNCAAGSVCFSARMYSSSGVVIQAYRVTAFPTTTSGLIVMGGESG